MQLGLTLYLFLCPVGVLLDWLVLLRFYQLKRRLGDSPVDVKGYQVGGLESANRAISYITAASMVELK